MLLLLEFLNALAGNLIISVLGYYQQCYFFLLALSFKLFNFSTFKDAVFLGFKSLVLVMIRPLQCLGSL